MASPETIWMVGVLGGIAAFTAALAVLAVKTRRAADAQRLALRAADIAAECKGLLPGPDFLWGVWQKTDDAAAMALLVRDSRDRVVAWVDKPHVATDGVVLRFELDGRRCEARRPGLLATRTELFEVGRTTALLAARHETLRTRFFRDGGATPMFVLPVVSVFHRYRPVKVGDEEIGRLIVGLRRHDAVGVLSLPAGAYTTLEQVFVLAQT
jgi:hypothetical protein